MKTLFVVMLTLSASPGSDAPGQPPASFQTPYSRSFDAAVAGIEAQAAPSRRANGGTIIRGQAPTYDPGAAAAPPPTEAFVPQGQPGVYGGDPFMGGAPGANPYGYAPNQNLGYGLLGPQPYRFGWTSRYDVGWLPSEGTDPNKGDLEIFEVNAAMRYTTGYPAGAAGWIFSWTPEFNYRGWQGPGGVDLPGSVYRFASDFELATSGDQPVSLQLGFTPAIVSDLAQNLNHDAYQFDGRAVAFFKASPDLTIALGAMILDRNRDYILPYAGVIWTPGPYWEFRLLFPKSRVSLFLGDFGGTSAWLYTGVEYNVEAYAIDMAGPNGRNEKIELVDYRWTFGLRTESFGVSSFIEGGYVFAREANFLNGTSDFDINNGFMLRGGLRF